MQIKKLTKMQYIEHLKQQHCSIEEIKKIMLNLEKKHIWRSKNENNKKNNHDWF